jgi:hypothetical protein
MVRAVDSHLELVTVFLTVCVYSLCVEIFATIEIFFLLWSFVSFGKIVRAASVLLLLMFFSCYFDHSSLSKNCASGICFVCYMLYYRRHFKIDLSFYIFAITFFVRIILKNNFLNEMNGQSYKKKIKHRQIFRYRWSYNLHQQEQFEQILSVYLVPMFFK